MMERYEIQQLRSLPIEEVAQRVGLEVSHHKSLCPFHDDHHASLSFNVRKNMYRCFVCGASGDNINLVSKCLNMGFREACNWLDNGSLNIVQKFQYSGCKLQKKTFDASLYEKFFEQPFLSDIAKRFLFFERQLDKRVVRWCRLSSWQDRKGINWLQIPYYDRQGRLIGIQNRNLNWVQGFPRFRFPYGAKCSIYNLPVLNLLKPNETLFITEGCSDCWAMLSSGHKAIAIPSATLLKPQDTELLSNLQSQLAIKFGMYPDNDEPGERLFMQLQEVIPDLEHHHLPLGCKDFSEYYLKNLRSKGINSSF